MVRTHVARGACTIDFSDVMSCGGRVIVNGDPDIAGDLAERAVDRLRALEQRWSRFLPTSDVSRLNDADGGPVPVSDETLTLVRRLVEAHALTGGAFDPTLLRPLVEQGYGTSRTDAGRRTNLHPHVGRRGSVGEVSIDGALITLPAGTALDPGGLGKGLAADLVADEMMRAGAAGCLVELGGDLTVRGDAAGGYAWTIALDNTGEAPLLLAAGGVAASSSQRRTWWSNGELRHHLIDPVTLRPTDRGVTECTVAAGTAAIAEALTKVAFVHGLADGVGFYADRGIAARVVDGDGSIVTTPAWRELQGTER